MKTASVRKIESIDGLIGIDSSELTDIHDVARRGEAILLPFASVLLLLDMPVVIVE